MFLLLFHVTLELVLLKYCVCHQQLFYPILSLLFILMIDFLSSEETVDIIHADMHSMLKGGWGQTK